MYLVPFALTIIYIISPKIVESGAIIGNGEVIIGIDDDANLNIAYESVLGMPASDPVGRGMVGLRSGSGDDAGDYTATEKGKSLSC